MKSPQALVLMYHQIVPEGSPEGWVPSSLADARYGVTLRNFARQMSFLRENGINVVSLDDWIGGQVPGDSSPSPCVIVTFDDGYESDWTLAAPVLESFSVPATFFVSTGYLGSTGMMNEDQLARLAENPLFSIGSHGETHRFLTTLPEESCRLELIRSFARIRSLTGQTAVDLSAPGGRINRAIAALARKAGYRAVLTSKPGILVGAGNLVSIPRLPILNAHSPEEFAELLDPRSWTFRMDRLVRMAKQGLRGLAMGIGFRDRIRT
ncbi:polysaccharide deacetylase [Leptospirillum ferriphilum]|jgi:peptidoglycan/xylan/chitin deacetylase (PgdA/CDA1 family)|uniref:Polysaccharide deacetylase n=2 Tax=Leptospirillum TaxID=179 RepID=A0A094X719_9BACT|nr:polysaccharide deacetylase family protein [Leptospirillum ferriphilum]KGA94349.1 polysaccharide deacetylase [Leptospirillum ferriphilum]